MSPAEQAAEPLPADEDRTARARIRDAALRRFAADGIAATSLRSIAEDAGVSPPLVIHYFGSKDGLRAACDSYVVAHIRDRKRAALRGSLDPLQALRDVEHDLPLLRYLARTLAGGSPHVADLIDGLVEDAVAYIDEGVASGMLQPTDQPRERAVVLVMWSLGGLVLHEHIERLIGADITGGPREWLSWIRPATEILAHGVLTEQFSQQWRGALDTYAAQQEAQQEAHAARREGD